MASPRLPPIVSVPGPGSTGLGTIDELTPTKLITKYMIQRSNEYVSLQRVKQIGWDDAAGDDHFRQQRRIADEASQSTKLHFLRMMHRIGHELENATGAFNVGKANFKVLDTCMAPGGFLKAVLDYHPEGNACAMTLPVRCGGHEVLIPYGQNDSRVEVMFVDITTLGLEFGLAKEELQQGMSTTQLFNSTQFDLVVCDGQVLRTDTKYQENGVDKHAAIKLSLSQLILAMTRLQPGGTLIMLLHKVEAWRTIKLLYTFSQFSEIHLYKPQHSHTSRNSFYLIAKNVQSTSNSALEAIGEWKATWRALTFDKDNSTSNPYDRFQVHVDDVKRVLDDFGEEFVKLAKPVWHTQKMGILRSSWFSKILKNKNLNIHDLY